MTAKCLASNVASDMTPAAGVLGAIVNHSEAARELIFAARPAVLPNLLNALTLNSPSLTAAVVGTHASCCATMLTDLSISPKRAHSICSEEYCSEGLPNLLNALTLSNLRIGQLLNLLSVSISGPTSFAMIPAHSFVWNGAIRCTALHMHPQKHCPSLLLAA